MSATHQSSLAARVRSDSLDRGLSLIELLIAIALGVVMSFAAMNLFLQSKLAYLQDDEMARLQENGRYALGYLSHELMMAGYLGTELPRHLADASDKGTACFEHLMNTAIALEHINDVTVKGTGSGETQMLPADCLVTGKHLAGTDLLVIRRTVDFPLIYEGEKSGTIEADDIYLRIARQGGVSAVRRGGEEVTAMMDLWEYVPQVMFVRNYSLASGDGIPTLCRKRLARTANRMAPTECLIEGIENLQLEFGIDENGNQLADRFVQQPDSTELAAAVVARIFLLVRSVYPVVGHVDDRSYDLGGKRIEASNDAYYRRVMQATVVLRNRGAIRL